MPEFKLVSPFQPTGDQPQAIAKLTEGLNAGHRYQTLLGATGTGKTYTIAKVIENVQKPTLVIAHNKTLAAQLYSEFREFFPHNAVSYFVSYYDYYQPEAYVPRHDSYIEKETRDQRRDRPPAAVGDHQPDEPPRRGYRRFVSCIYGIANPTAWGKVSVKLERGNMYRRDSVLRHLVDIQYERNDMDLRRGVFPRARRHPGGHARLRRDRLLGRVLGRRGRAHQRVRSADRRSAGRSLGSRDLPRQAVHHRRGQAAPGDQSTSKASSNERIAYFRERKCSWRRSASNSAPCYDLEMLREIGYTSGIENYSRHLDQRQAGEPPWTLVRLLPA
jgi:excinuclease ABC subunit B